MISTRLRRVGVSATMHINATAKQMKAEGIDVIDLSVGEPDFPTPAHIREAAKRAIDDGITRYTMNDGLIELRKAICDKLRRDNAVEFEPNQVIVSTGAKQCVYNACAALVSDGDRVIVPAPYWVSYPEMVRLVGGEPVIVETSEEDGFRLTPERLRPHLDGAKVLMLNSPSNPTGAVYGREQLRAVVELAVGAGLTVISDEIYEKLVYDGAEFTCVASLSPEIREHTVTVNGVSKAYAMTGWRIGYAAGPRAVIKAMSTVQGHTTSNACSVSQMAGLAALTGPQDPVAEMAREFDRRRRAVLDRVRRISGWTCPTPGGAFYVFPHVEASLNTRGPDREIKSSLDLAAHLLEHARAAVVPGEAFGAPGFIRISYANSLERLETALERIAEAIGELRRT